MAKQQSFKVANSKVWIVQGQEVLNKRAAYRYCDTLNATKTGGTKPYKVERKNA
jgi:hypothetical protein